MRTVHIYVLAYVCIRFRATSSCLLFLPLHGEKKRKIVWICVCISFSFLQKKKCHLFFSSFYLMYHYFESSIAYQNTGKRNQRWIWHIMVQWFSFIVLPNTNCFNLSRHWVSVTPIFHFHINKRTPTVFI